jgi:hypothetical protein
MYKLNKFVLLLIISLMLIGINGCTSNPDDTAAITVSEPYSIRMFALKKHSGDLYETRVFEANTKGDFDSLIRKYKIQYDSKECKYQFDKNFFKNNKLYVIHVNYYNECKIKDYNIKNEDGIIKMVFYGLFPRTGDTSVKEGYYGEIVAVSKDFAEGADLVNVDYEEYKGN